MAEERSRLLVGHDEDGRVAATAFLTLNSHRLMTHWLWLYTVMVHPRHQGKGRGRDLMAAAERAARGIDGIEAVRLTCRGGLGLERFYASCGYKEVGRVPGAIRVGPDDDRDDVIMLLPLTCAPARPPPCKIPRGPCFTGGRSIKGRSGRPTRKSGSDAPLHTDAPRALRGLPRGRLGPRLLGPRPPLPWRRRRPGDQPGRHGGLRPDKLRRPARAARHRLRGHRAQGRPGQGQPGGQPQPGGRGRRRRPQRGPRTDLLTRPAPTPAPAGRVTSVTGGPPPRRAPVSESPGHRGALRCVVSMRPPPFKVRLWDSQSSGVTVSG